MLLTLFYIFLIAWIAGVIRFFDIGHWNWLLLGVALVFLIIRAEFGGKKRSDAVARSRR